MVLVAVVGGGDGVRLVTLKLDGQMRKFIGCLPEYHSFRDPMHMYTASVNNKFISGGWTSKVSLYTVLVHACMRVLMITCTR